MNTTKKTNKNYIFYVIAALCLCSCLFIPLISAEASPLPPSLPPPPPPPPPPPQTPPPPGLESHVIEPQNVTQGLYKKSTQMPAHNAEMEFNLERDISHLVGQDDIQHLLASDEGWIYYTEDEEKMLLTAEGWVHSSEDGEKILSPDDGWVYVINIRLCNVKNSDHCLTF